MRLALGMIMHVQVVPAGTRMNVLNQDGIAHNLHTLSAENPSFNRLQPGVKKRMVTRKNDLAVPEIIPLKCDLHGWMRRLLSSPTTSTMQYPTGRVPSRSPPFHRGRTQFSSGMRPWVRRLRR